MSDLLPKATPARTTGLGPKAQKLQAMKEKLAAQNGTAGGAKAASGAGSASVAKPKSNFAGKKTSFQRKAV